MFGFEGLVDLLYDWYTGLITAIVSVLFQNAVPTTDEIMTDFFAVSVGGTLGAARVVVNGIAIIIVFVVILSPTRSHGKRISRLVKSVVLVALFGWLFYPIYSLIYNLSQGLTEAALILGTSGSDGDIAKFNTMIEGLTFIGVFDKFVAALLSGTFSFVALAEVWIMKILLMGVLIGYPLVLALLPLGWFVIGLFHAANSIILVIVIAPPLMALGFALPLISRNLIPGGSAFALESMTAIIGSLLALAIPIVLFFLAFKASHEVFGRLETMMSGAIDVASMPPMTLNEMQKDVGDTHSGFFKTVVVDTVGDAVLYGNGSGSIVRDMGRAAVDMGATAATLAGHPWIGAAVKGGGVMVGQALDRRNAGSEVNESEPEEVNTDEQRRPIEVPRNTSE